MHHMFSIGDYPGKCTVVWCFSTTASQQISNMNLCWCLPLWSLHFMSSGVPKLTVGTSLCVCVCVHGCLSLCCLCNRQWLPIKGVPSLSPDHSWDRLLWLDKVGIEHGCWFYVMIMSIPGCSQLFGVYFGFVGPVMNWRLWCPHSGLRHDAPPYRHRC